MRCRCFGLVGGKILFLFFLDLLYMLWCQSLHFSYGCSISWTIAIAPEHFDRTFAPQRNVGHCSQEIQCYQNFILAIFHKKEYLNICKFQCKIPLLYGDAKLFLNTEQCLGNHKTNIINGHGLHFYCFLRSNFHSVHGTWSYW